MVLMLIALLMTSPAFASPAGTCKSLDAYYKNVTFNVDEFDDVGDALDFTEAHKGQLITDKDEGTFSVIWVESFAAPETQYQCSHITEN